MLSDLKDKRALVTGAAQGLGRAIAELFVERGARVVLTDIDGDLLDKTVADLGTAAHGVVADVTSEAQVSSSVTAAVDHLGGLDIAVNNAGIEIGKPLVEQTEDEFDRLMSINVKGVFLGIKHETPAMIASGGGNIVNMSSVAGLGGVPLLGTYCASKAAVLRLTETAAVELRAHGVRVNAVCPSFINTDMVARLVNPFEGATGAKFDDLVAVKQQRLGTPEEVAETVAFLASDDARFVTGAHFTLDGGLTGSLF
ncbi:MAG TPA: SDR family oxidoreductase [Pseudonocardia sp.]|jgi:NAD(P)-dependent dehydrogenase (short-subunit alcohol dehydrogenase family)